MPSFFPESLPYLSNLLYAEEPVKQYLGDLFNSIQLKDIVQRHRIRDVDLLADEATVQREFGVYDSVKDNFPKYVVSMDELDLSRNGIKHYNIRDFLTDKNWSQ